jgi:peptidyl-prolyl isomerase G (cyclophilin G)
VKGFEEVVKRIEGVKTMKEGDRPVERVVVVACGELEYRGPAVTAAKATSRERAGKRGRSRSRSRSTASPTSDSDDSDERKERKRRKREAKRRKKEGKGKGKPSARSSSPSGVGVEDNNATPANDPLAMETEEEYDLRLEREENARKEARKAREREEARLGRVDERTGVRYKGQSNNASIRFVVGTHAGF